MQYCRRHLEDPQVHRRWIDPRLYELRVGEIRAYLLGKNWKEVPPDRPGVLVFEEPTTGEAGPLYQWVPDSEQRRDYFQAVYELLAGVAELEDRYAGEVLADMRKAAEEGALNGPQTTAKGETVRQG